MPASGNPNFFVPASRWQLWHSSPLPENRFAGSLASGPIVAAVFTIRSRPTRTVRPNASIGSASTSGTAHSSADALVNRLPQISAIITRSRHIARSATIPPHRGSTS
jgi:hypothetical protein